MAITEAGARKVALVTGASKGIGLAIAQALSSAGFSIVGCARDLTSLDAALSSLRASGASVMTAACDVADEAQVERLFAELIARFGRLDVLVNNAGVFEKTPIEQMSAAQWDRVMGINTRGVFLCSRAAFRVMREGGDIINISSLGGVKNVEKFIGTSAYVASKYAVAGLTEALAAEGKARGIRVKAVSPGAVDTELLASADNGLAAGMSASELAKIVVFLVSDAARALSGTNLEIYSNA